MKDRGMLVTWETNGETFTGKVSNQDNKDAQELYKQGKLSGKVIVRMEIPAAKDKQYHYKGGVQKILIRAEKLKLIGYYDYPYRGGISPEPNI